MNKLKELYLYYGLWVKMQFVSKKKTDRMKQLAWLIEWFAYHRPWFGDLSNPLSVGACEYACKLFIADIERWFPYAKIYYLKGSKLSFPNRHADYQTYTDPGPDLHHCVVVYGGIVIDFARRQFDPDADYPHIASTHTYLADWEVKSMQPLE